MTPSRPTPRSSTPSAVRDGRDGARDLRGLRLPPGASPATAFFHFSPLGGRDARGCRVDCADAAHDVTGRPIAALA